MINKSEILNKRKNLDPTLRLQLSDLIADKIIEMPEYKDSDTVLIYADYNNEVATDKLICRALLDSKFVYMPVSNPDYTLDFYRVYAIDELISGAYGIREPLRIEYLKLDKAKISSKCICITPGSAFDSDCNRMGYGKGFYDRFFAECDIKNRIGIAFELQIVPHITVNEHDIPLSAVVTEQNIYRRKQINTNNGE